MSGESDGSPPRGTQSVIYVEPRALHESGFLKALRRNAAGYQRQLDTIRETSENAPTPMDVLREVVEEFESRPLETLTPVIEELRRRNGTFEQRRLVERRREATERFLQQVRETFAEVAVKIDMDVEEFERCCVDPVTVVVELPEETRDSLRRELERFYDVRTEEDENVLPENPSLQTLVTRCVQAARRSKTQ